MPHNELELIRDSRDIDDAIELGELTEAEFKSASSPEEILALSTYRNFIAGRDLSRGIFFEEISEEEIKLQPDQFKLLEEYRGFFSNPARFSSIPGPEELGQQIVQAGKETISNLTAIPALAGFAGQTDIDERIAFKKRTGQPLDLEEEQRFFQQGGKHSKASFRCRIYRGRTCAASGCRYCKIWRNTYRSCNSHPFCCRFCYRWSFRIYAYSSTRSC